MGVKKIPIDIYFFFPYSRIISSDNTKFLAVSSACFNKMGKTNKSVWSESQIHEKRLFVLIYFKICIKNMTTSLNWQGFKTKRIFEQIIKHSCTWKYA